MTRPPVWFLSHGGPNIIENTQHPAYAELQRIGREITQKVKPKAVVVFSAHWQGDFDGVVEVNTAESVDLIYDFYGFPSHYYDFKYPHKGSPELAEKLLGVFNDAGIAARGVRRGLDHGVWAGFSCAFPETNPLNVPIVQVSLFASEDPDQHYKLGQAVSALRDEGILIIGSGMAVHNLRDFRRAWQTPGPMPYAVSFDGALKDAVEQSPEQRQQAMRDLLKRPDARKAHPTFEHLLPIHVAAGAAGAEAGRRIWTLPEGSLSWAQFRFGDIET